mgnify:CR=1 FL=1
MTNSAQHASEHPRGGNGLETVREPIRRGAVVLLLIALVVGFSLAQPVFLNLNNLMSI